MTYSRFYDQRPVSHITRYILATHARQTQDLEPAWIVIPTPVGARLAVIETSQFVIMDPYTGDRCIINRNANQMHHLCFSPDMRRLAYIQNPDYGTVYSLVIMNIDGADQKTIYTYDISDGYIAGLHDLVWLPE